ncbi:MAG: hypothetical protein AAGN35_24700 [Bacteroidota bacterium]
MAQNPSELFPDSWLHVNGPGLQTVDPAFFQYEKKLLEDLETGDYSMAIRLCNELLISLEKAKAVKNEESEYFKYLLYLHNVHRAVFDSNFVSRNLFNTSIEGRIGYLTYHRDQLLQKHAPNSSLQRQFLRYAFYLKGGALFREFWRMSPSIDFSDDFLKEMLKYALDLNSHYFDDNFFLESIEGLIGFKEDQYDLIYRISDADLQRLKNAGFPNHKPEFAEKYPEECAMFDRIQHEGEQGKWVIILR